MNIESLRENVVNLVDKRDDEWFNSFALYQSIFDKEALTKNLETFLANLEKLEVDFEVIEKSFKDAVDFAENYLKLGLPRQIKNKINDGIKNKKDLENFLKNTVLYKKESQKIKANVNLGIASQYSLITKVAIAEFLYHKDELQSIIHETEYVYKDLITRKEGVQNFFVPEFKESYDNLFIYNYDNDYDNDRLVKAKACWRGKRQDSIVAKLLNKKEYSIDEAIKDGIGFKFEVENTDNAIILMKNLVITFVGRYKADNFVIKNVNFLNNLQEKELCDRLKNRLGDENVEVEIAGNYNPSSNDNFKTLKIAEGEIKVKENGEDENDFIKRGFEVQIVLVNNKNETGLAHHSVYEGKKKLNIASRLLGLFDERYLDAIVKEVSEKSGVSKEKIKENYLKVLKVFTDKNDRKKYLTEQVYNELLEQKKN